MSKINVDTWEPESGTAATLMASGDTVTVPSGASLVVASGATINITGATQTGFPSSGFASLQLFVSTGTWTKPADITTIIVEVQGSGGGSGSLDGSGYVGGSGGGGAYALKVLDVTNIDTATVTVGAGGLAAAAGNTSSFAKLAGSGSFTTVTCAGGNGGVNASGAQGNGGIGAAQPTTGDINLAGGDGAHGSANFLTAIGGSGQLGQATLHNIGTTQAARTPIGYGAGSGSGTGSSQAGGVAATGTVRVWEYK